MKKILITLLSLLVAVPLMAAESLNGAGASFPFPVYSSWAYSYEKETGTKVNYQSIGSGGGIKQITAGTVDFGASDDPLTQADLDKNNLLNPQISGHIQYFASSEPESFKQNAKIFMEIDAEPHLVKL